MARIVVLIFLMLLAGCASVQTGAIYPDGGDVRVYKNGQLVEWAVPGLSWSIGTGAVSSGGGTGTRSGRNPDGSSFYNKLGPGERRR